MVRNILFTMLLACSVPALSHAASPMPGISIIESEFNKVAIYYNGTSLRVTNANGMVLSIYSITGVKVMNVKVEGSDKSYNLNLQRGCYIVKVGNVVRKISVR